MRKSFILILVCAAAGVVAALAPGLSHAQAAERPTFERDVLPILQENCQTCHRPKGANLGWITWCYTEENKSPASRILQR